MELFADVHVVKRHAIVDVLCGPVVNVVNGVHVFVLSVPLEVVHVVPIFLAVILYQFITLFHRSHFSHVFTVFSRHFRCGICTPVGYNRPQSAVNDPTATKQMNSRKSCLQEVSKITYFYQVSLINQYWVHLHGDFRRNKESTMFLASSTKKKNSFVSIVSFVELLLLFPSIAARLTMLVCNQICAEFAWYRN